jgi:hypothetical protein
LNESTDGINLCLSGIFIIEAIIKIMGMGFVLHKTSYLRDGWNCLDFVVVAASVIQQIIVALHPGHAESSGVAALRTFRLLRPLRLLGRVKALKTLICTLLCSLQALSATMGLACFIFIVYAIFGITVW